MVAALLDRLGVNPSLYQTGKQPVHSPIDGSQIGSVHWEGAAEVEQQVSRAELHSRPGAKYRRRVVASWCVNSATCCANTRPIWASWCPGKPARSLRKAWGEVQEMIDICDFAVGLSRQLYGLTIASERPGHHMRETWHPLGVVGVISAFNFPVAVWAWNTALALVCGNAVIWKPSEKTPLTGPGLPGAVRARAEEIQRAPPDLSQVIIGGRDAGAALVDDPRVALISATGSTRMGREVAPKVAARFARSILELGGNNAMILGQAPTWTWPCAPFCSAPSAPPASAAPPCAA